MSNEKSIQRDPFPIICPAGTKNEPSPINELLKNYDKSEAAEYILKKEKDSKISSPQYVYEHMSTNSVKDLLDIYSTKTKFDMFKENFYENLYYKKKPLAKVCAPKWFVHSKGPDFTFGDPSKSYESLYELVLPKKKWEQIDEESRAAHDLYVLSHNDYYPSEKCNRKYNEHFNSEKIYGKPTQVDISGMTMKRLFSDLKTCPRRSNFINMTQKNYFDRSKHQVGAALKKQGFEFDESDIYFGHPKYSDKFGLKELIQEKQYVNIQDQEFYDAFGYIRYIRKKILHLRFFYMNNLRKLCSGKDKDGTGFIPWNDVFLLAKHIGLILNMKHIEYMAKYYNIVSEDGSKVNYRDLCDLLNVRIELPRLKKTDEDIMVGDTTTYREFTKDLAKQSFEECLKPAAGVNLSTRPKPIDIKSSIDNLGDETTMKSLLNPSMPTYFNLTHRDFLCARSKDDIKKIFQGAQFDLSNFDEIFEEGRTIIPCDEEGKCTVEGFKAATNEMKKFRNM